MSCRCSGAPGGEALPLREGQAGELHASHEPRGGGESVYVLHLMFYLNKALSIMSSVAFEFRSVEKNVNVRFILDCTVNHA